MESALTTRSGAKQANARATTTADRFARLGLWFIPVYGVLLALSTLTQQPDYETDFESYAEYITTDGFLASHLGASIAGAALGVLGVVAALAFLVRGAAVTAAILGAAFMIVSNIVLSAIFGVAAFAQPAIGRAFLGGESGVRDLTKTYTARRSSQPRGWALSSSSSGRSCWASLSPASGEHSAGSGSASPRA